MNGSHVALALAAAISLGLSGCDGANSPESPAPTDQSSTAMDIVFDDIVSLGNTASDAVCRPG